MSAHQKTRFIAAAAAGVVLLVAGCAEPPGTPVAPRPEVTRPRPEPSSTVSAHIYLPTVSGGELRLARTKVELPAGSGKRDVIQELLEARPGGQRIFPAGTKVLSYSASSAGEATLTLSNEIRNYSGGSAEEAAAVNALVLTTAEVYPDTRTVRIKAADGELESLGGHLDLTVPLKPDRTSVVEGQ